MPSSTSVTLTVRGVDATRAAFRRVRANVALMAARVRQMATVGVAGAGALTAAVVAAANSLSTLSDRAAQAGTTADELQRLTTALGVAGAKGANLETISQGLARMTQATGRTGLQGLAETLEDISRIGDEGGRIRELSRVFGRAFGPGLAAFVRNGPDRIRASLDTIVAAMPGVDNALAGAGDALADGFAIAKDGVLRSLQSLLVEIGNRIVGSTGYTARQLGAVIGAYARYYATVVAANLGDLPAYVGSILEEIGARLGHKVREWTGWIGDLFAYIGKGWDFIGGIVAGEGVAGAAESAQARWAESYEDQLARIRAARAGLLKSTAEQRAELDRSLAAAAKLDDALANLGGGATPHLAAGVEGALGPVRDAAAVLSNSYQAFRIASQRGLGGSNGGISAERAAQSTAQNTGRMVTSLDQLNRNAQKAYAALQGLPPVYVL